MTLGSGVRQRRHPGVRQRRHPGVRQRRHPGVRRDPENLLDSGFRRNDEGAGM